jgi:hypothetical protein
MLANVLIVGFMLSDIKLCDQEKNSGKESAKFTISGLIMGRKEETCPSSLISWYLHILRMAQPPFAAEFNSARTMICAHAAMQLLSVNIMA